MMTEKWTLDRIARTRNDEIFLARLLEFMQGHRGAARAITGKQIAAHFGFENDRIIRAGFAALTERGHMIASSVHAPYGFYLVETVDEAEQYDRTLHSRAMKTLKHLRDFRAAVARRFGPAQQLPLNLVERALGELETPTPPPPLAQGRR